MKKIIASLGILGGLFFASAQQTEKVDSVFLKNWMHSDFETTGVYGVNTLKAKEFLAQHKRKPVSIVVGVLDSGVEYFHEDLKNNMWVNPKEKAENGKDDDKNGYTDDIHGWNFVTDKNGKNYAGDTYEMTRQYSKLAQIYENGNASSNPAEYQKYLDLKKDYYTTISRTQLNRILAETRLKYAEPRLNALKSVLGNQIVTKEVVGNIKTDNQLALEGLYIFKELNETEWNNKKFSDVADNYLKKLKTTVSNADKNLGVSYSLNFNPKSGISGKYYGNNDVKGLEDGHGTHVSGIIAAEWDNGKGMMGTGGGNYVKIMGVRVVPDGDERDEDIANGIRYAVDNGAKILNMSFGKAYDDNSKLVVDAFKYAEAQNVLIVKSAGNDNMDVDTNIKYPLTLIDGKQFSSSVLTVGANTRFSDNLRARFSNWGKKAVDVFAPGTEIYATYPDGKYRFLQGTSMATPAVSGVAALVWAYYPKLTAKDIKTILVETVNKSDQLKDISVSGGVVDTYKAVQKAEEIYKQRKLK